jgi:hypothetical protein
MFMSDSRTKYGIMSSPTSFRILPELLSGPTVLFLPTTANLLLMILVLMAKGSHELVNCTSICDILRSELNTEE